MDTTVVENEIQKNEGIRYPLEYFAAPVIFADRIASITEKDFIDSLSEYTGLKNELIGASYLDEPSERTWEEFISSIEGKSVDEISRIAYDLYSQQPYSKFDSNWIPPYTKRFGALGVDTHPYNLDSRRNQVKLHFLATRKNGSDLSSSKTEERRRDMKNLLQWVKSNHPDIQNITSFTWLQNLPNYRALFPPTFLDRLQTLRNKFGGLWGQFVKWDGSANRANYDQFIINLNNAKTLDDAIDAFPLKVLGAVGPIEEFYRFYGVE